MENDSFNLYVWPSEWGSHSLQPESLVAMVNVFIHLFKIKN
jgi:hypothetical protein